VKVSANIIARAMRDFFRELTLPLAGADLLRSGSVVAAVCDIPWASVNLVWLERPDPEVADVLDLLELVSARGVPHALALRPDSGKALAEVAALRGMTAGRSAPMMAVNRAADIRPPEDLTIRLLAPHETAVHALLCSQGFRMPDELMRRTVTEDTLKSSAVRCYVGEVAGRPATTGLTVTTGAFTGIINIATDPAYRGRGFGTAITARAVEDGLAAGASWCWLSSSQQAYSMYESYGFRLIESWPIWVSSPDPG
jgi:predicted GNAT family acetyltransferase